jgi:acyl-CoA thioesterase I
MFQFLFCLLLIAVPGIGSAATILIMGDSISAAYGFEVDQGWPALLQQKLNRQDRGDQVVNASISGETSAGGSSRIDQELQNHRPAIVIIELGANDGLRGYPPPRMKANLKRMIERSQAGGALVLLLGMRIPPNYGRRYTEMFYRVYTELEKEQAIAFVPFLLDGVAAQTGMIQHDGLHPNAKAQPIIMELVWKKLEPMLNQVTGIRQQGSRN